VTASDIGVFHLCSSSRCKASSDGYREWGYYTVERVLDGGGRTFARPGRSWARVGRLAGDALLEHDTVMLDSVYELASRAADFRLCGAGSLLRWFGLRGASQPCDASSDVRADEDRSRRGPDDLRGGAPQPHPTAHPQAPATDGDEGRGCVSLPGCLQDGNRSVACS
jgi:hypothetical protein